MNWKIQWHCRIECIVDLESTDDLSEMVTPPPQCGIVERGNGSKVGELRIYSLLKGFKRSLTKHDNSIS